MHFRGYEESTLKGISKKLRQLGREADLKNPETVLKYMHARALEEEEIKQFQNSASIVRNITQSLGL